MLCKSGYGLGPPKFFEIDIEPSSQSCSSWSSWSAGETTSNRHLKAVVGYCPMLNAKSDDPSTVYTVLLHLKRMMEILGQKHSVITFDLAIYKVAKEVVWSNPEMFKFTVVRLGGFHIILNFLGALGNMLQTSGAIGVITEAGVFSETTVKHVFSGGDYKKGIRCHKLLYEALMRKKLVALKDWLTANNAADPLCNIDLSDEYSVNELKAGAEAITKLLHELDATVSDESALFKFWSIYLKAVTALLALIRAERSGDWELYLESLICMLPVFYAYDRINYSRWLPVYIADMINLEDTAKEVYDEFKAGRFSVNRTGKSFAAVPTDQVLEQTLNKDSKGSGGLKGISNNEVARTKWFLSSHVRAQMYAAQKEFISKNRDGTAGKHREENVTITMKDEADVQALMSTLHKYASKIFSREKTALINIFTGISPPTETGAQILAALTDGEKRLKEFIEDRLSQEKKTFDATLSKQKVPAFDKKGTSSVERKIQAKGQIPFAKLLIVGQSRNLNVKELFKHEMSNIPPALFDNKGIMRKCKKSQLVNVLEEKFLNGCGDDTMDHRVVIGKALVIDAMVMVQMLKATGTFDDYSKALFDSMLSESLGYHRVDIVFDVYDAKSIKSAERARRGAQQMCNIHITNGEMRVPKHWDDFLSNIHNKNELVKFLMTSWKSMSSQIPAGQTIVVSGEDVFALNDELLQTDHVVSNHDEADTRLVLHASELLKDSDTVVIRTVDTDILVIALHHYQSMISGLARDKHLILWIGTGSHKRFLSVTQLNAVMPANIKDNLLAAYALTGCDSVSGLFHITKARAIATFEKHSFNLSEVGEPNTMLSQACESECERFLAMLYGDYTNLTEARYKMYAIQKTTRNDALLPPSSNAAKFHIRRASYQILLWKLSLKAMIQPEELPSLKDYGWDETLHPILCEPSPMQQQLLIACNCKSSGCKNRSCKCVKNSEACTDACGCIDCSNKEDEPEDDGEESDPEDEGL